MRPNRMAVLCTLAALAPALPGCIVRDIRDEMRLINERMYSIDRQLDQLAETNQAINSAVQEVKSVDESIRGVQERLAILDSIDASLKNLDVHLASLRKTINNIDATIPFLSISGDEGEDNAGDDASVPEAQQPKPEQPGGGG